jgi:hypothetical protein
MQSSFLVVFTVLWSAFTLFFDGMMARGMFRQYESRLFPAMTGQVTHSEVMTHHGSKGKTSYEAVIDYRFEVGGQAYTGSRLRYGFSASDYGWR